MPISALYDYGMDYSQIYFSVLSVSTLAIAGLLVLILFYVIAILHDIKRLSKIAKTEAVIIARSFEKGASLIGNYFSDEAAGFLKTVFSLLLAQFGNQKTSRRKTGRVKEV